MRAGNFIFGDDNQRIFIPNPLPPDPKLHFDAEIRSLHTEAEKSIYILAGALRSAQAFPEIINALLTAECVANHSIDGGTISLEDYFTAEASGKPESVAEISNTLSALNLGLNLLKNVGSSSHIFKSVHSELTGRQSAFSGQYRAEKINFSRQPESGINYLPPGPESIAELMAGLEKYISTDISYPALINAALIHAQFEMIHPFSSGNGKLGRILILLQLKWKKLLPVPALMISQLLYKNSPEYFGRLAALETGGDWESWIKFFLGIVRLSAEHSVRAISALSALKNRTLSSMIEKKFVSPAAIELMQLLFEQPAVTLPFLTERLRFTKQTANVTAGRFVEEKILIEKTGRMRNRVFIFQDFFSSFSESN